jgi:N-acetylglutamate synthase-like GNAT family acetyltransferase/uncharacterized damage-inducible protein DinB
MSGLDAAIASARARDLAGVKGLLRDARLPDRDVEAPLLAHFLVARRGGRLVGVVGLEPFGRCGLLRSLAVAPAERGRGLGVTLTRALERRARDLGIAQLYLLTTTAEAFFARLGYRVLPRDRAPAAIQGTTEYRELCASTSICMVKDLEEEAMAGVTIERPSPDEYAAYFSRYVDLMPDGNVLEHLTRQVDATAGLVAQLSDADADFRYAEGKWSIKEVLGHLVDAERIFLYRAVCFARGEPKELPGWDENEYVSRAKFGARRLGDLVAELRTARADTVSFFGGLDAEELRRRGVANGRDYSVRSIAYIAGGHERHHARILAERYLPGLVRR